MLVAFGGITNALIPLYAVGVFTSFTLSQAGMVRHHQKEREKGYKRNIVINAVGSVATFIVLLIVDTTDVIFATDSIPAIFAVTRDPFIVYTSNICAVLGLRALYFLLASIVDKFVYLKLGLSIVLIFIGAKMLLESFIHIPILAALGVVGVVLGTSILASVKWPKTGH